MNYPLTQPGSKNAWLAMFPVMLVWSCITPHVAHAQSFPKAAGPVHDCVTFLKDIKNKVPLARATCANVTEGGKTYIQTTVANVPTQYLSVSKQEKAVCQKTGGDAYSGLSTIVCRYPQS